MNAIAILPATTAASSAGQWIAAQCQAAGVKLTVSHDLSGQPYIAAFTSHQNVITWNCGMPHDWTRKGDRNVLYVENSLISQKAGMFIDARGFFTHSNLHTGQHWNAPGSFNIDFFARREFDWTLHSGGDPTGPILVALQCRRDSNLKQNYPAAHGYINPNLHTLDLVLKHLPSTIPVQIRPHPREPDIDTRDWPSHWTLQREGKFSHILPRARALVSATSTCISEATLLGIPIATLGVGAFTGSGTTLECAHHPARLANLPTYQPDLDAHRRYATAILSQHFLPYDAHPDRHVPEFQKWLSNLTKQS